MSWRWPQLYMLAKWIFVYSEDGIIIRKSVVIILVFWQVELFNFGIIYGSEVFNLFTWIMTCNWDTFLFPAYGNWRAKCIYTVITYHALTVNPQDLRHSAINIEILLIFYLSVKKINFAIQKKKVWFFGHQLHCYLFWIFVVMLKTYYNYIKHENALEKIT